jgi:molybdopterin-dependent oxidoreductase alpha subunit
VLNTDPPRSDVDESDLTVHDRKHWAAGVPAVAASMRNAVEQMGVARTASTLLRLNQTTGFDCPSCAWPDPAPGERHTAEFCENGAKAVAEEATVRTVSPAFFAEHSLASLAERTDYWLGQQGRITHPMVRREGGTHYEPISWDDAFALVAEHLRSIDPDEAIFYTSGRTSNEAAFAYQLFARAYGTNNMPDCSNMCHESTSVGLAENIGIGKGSVSLEDVHCAELIVIMGQNPGTNHPRMLSALEIAKKRGAKILAINPLPEAGLLKFRNPQSPIGVTKGTDLADEFLQIRVNGDLALMQALGSLLLQAEDAAEVAGRKGSVIDWDFVAKHTVGFEQWAQHVRVVDWDVVTASTGLARAEIESAARMLVESKATVFCWAMGITQHRNAVATIKEITNVALAQGNIGKPGAGLCPVRGHSNVQGDRTMGIWEKPPAHFLDALATEFGFEPPREHGLDVVDSIRAMRDRKASFFMGMGGNFVRATPDTAVTEAALESTALTVQVSTKLNRSHVLCGRTALILPTLGRTDLDRTGGRKQFVTVEDSMSSVHASRGRLVPASDQLRSEVDIVCSMAIAVLGERYDLDWAAMRADYTQIRRHIAGVVPGCAAYHEKVDQPGGFVLPHPPRDTRTFETKAGKAIFETSPIDVLTVPEGRLIMQTLRSHDQFNTTIYGLDDRYRGIKNGRRVVFVHPDDVRDLGLHDGQVVDLVSEWEDGTERHANAFRVVPYSTPRGCAAAYYPETNPLVPLDFTATGSNQPAYKSIVVRLVPGAGAVSAGGQPHVGNEVGSDDHHRSDVEPHHLS